MIRAAVLTSSARTSFTLLARRTIRERMVKAMRAPRRCLFPLLTLEVLLSVSAGAAEPPVTHEASPGADDRRAAAVLAALGEQAGELKTVGSWSTVILGGALTTAGILVDSRYDTTYGRALWVGGLGLIAGGLTSLFVRPPIETFADEMGPSPAGLASKWRARAEQARSRRETLGVIELAIGFVGAGAATILAAGVGDLSRHDRAEWITLTALASGSGFASGLYRLVVPSDIENGYAVAYPALNAAATTINVGIAPLPNGGTLQLQASF
jgi:hypothetical protein